jgi:hypothetical protein
MHCFSLLEVFCNQLERNRIKAKQCYSISYFGFVGTEIQEGRAALRSDRWKCPRAYCPGTENVEIQHDEGEAFRRAFAIVAAFPQTMM